MRSWDTVIRFIFGIAAKCWLFADYPAHVLHVYTYIRLRGLVHNVVEQMRKWEQCLLAGCVVREYIARDILINAHDGR